MLAAVNRSSSRRDLEMWVLAHLQLQKTSHSHGATSSSGATTSCVLLRTTDADDADASNTRSSSSSSLLTILQQTSASVNQESLQVFIVAS